MLREKQGLARCWVCNQERPPPSPPALSRFLSSLLKVVSLCVFCICVCHCISHLFPKMNQNPRRSYRKLTGWRSLWLKHTMCSNDTSRCHSCRFRQPLEQWACRLFVFFTRQRYVLPHGANVVLSVTWFYILTFNFIFCTFRASESDQLLYSSTHRELDSLWLPGVAASLDL